MKLLDSIFCLYYSVYFIHVLVDPISHDVHNKNFTFAKMLDCLREETVSIISIFVILYKDKVLCAHLCNKMRKEVKNIL